MNLRVLMIVDPLRAKHPVDVRFPDALYIGPSTRALVFSGES